jgi:hypothetical protein
MARQKAIIPEVVEPDEKLPHDLVALRQFARLMDEWMPIPGTNRRIGLDAGLGFVPGIGDAVGALLSTWIVIGALRHRVPWVHIVRMIVNILIDLLIGEIPVLGDIFDIAFEENVINLRLLLAHRDRRTPPRSLAGVAWSAVLVVAIVAAAAFGLLVAMIVGAIWLANQR